MNKKGTNYLCRGCFKTTPKQKRYSKGFCSKECRQLRVSNCNSGGHGEKIIVDVIFKNGTQHRKEVCVLCGKGEGGSFVKKRRIFTEDNWIGEESEV